MANINTFREVPQVETAYQVFNEFYSAPDNTPFIEAWGSRSDNFAGLKEYLDRKLSVGELKTFFSKDIRIIGIGTSFGTILIHDDSVDGLRSKFAITFPEKSTYLFLSRKVVTNDPWILRFLLGRSAHDLNIGTRFNSMTKEIEKNTLEKVNKSNTEILDAWENFRSWPAAPDFAFLPVAPKNDERFVNSEAMATTKFNTLLKEVNIPSGLPFMITSDELHFCQVTPGCEVLVACFGREGYAVCVMEKKPNTEPNSAA